MAERKAFLLRLDPALHKEIEALAAAELRSVNGQVEYLLREAVRRRRGGAPAAMPAEAAPDATPVDMPAAPPDGDP